MAHFDCLLMVTTIKTDAVAAPSNAGRRWSTRWLLIWLVVACLIPGLIGTFVLLLDEYRTGRARLASDTIQTTRALAQAVDGHLLKVQIAAQSLATAGSLAKRNFADFQRRAKELLQATHAGSHVILADSSGQQIMNTLNPYPVSLPLHSNPAAIHRVFETGKPVISGIFVGRMSHMPHMSVDVPVFVEGQVKFALSIIIEPDDLNGILRAQRLPENWVVTILDATGHVVSRTHNPQQFVGQMGAADLIQHVREMPDGAVERTTSEGIPVISVFSRSPLTDWAITIGIPRSELEAELLRRLLILAIGLVAVFSFSAILAWLIGNRISRSVRALLAPARALGAGETLPQPEVFIAEAEEVVEALREAADLLDLRNTKLEAINQSLMARKKELLEAHRLGKFGVWQWSVVSGEISVSEEIRRIYGRDVPSFPEQRGTLLTIESWERVNAAIQESLKTGRGYDLELQAMHIDGRLIWINAKCEALLNPEGDVVTLRGTVQDISEQKAAAQALHDSESRFRATFDQAAVGMAHVSLEGNWLSVNDKICEIIGYPREELCQLTFQKITYPPDLDSDLVYLEQLIAGRIPSYSMEKRYVRKDGSLIWGNLTVALVRTAQGNPDYFVSVIEDIQPRKEAEAALAETREAYRLHLEQQVAERTEELVMANEALQRLAHQDALTKLSNRLAANERLRQEFLRLKRTGIVYCVLMIDIDHFKGINDTYGHETGDNVLVHFAQILSNGLRATDFTARFGGEEFLAILPSTSLEGAHAIAEKIRQSIQNERFPVVGSVTVSIGIAMARPTDANEDVAVRQADAALYQSKDAGRNTVRF